MKTTTEKIAVMQACLPDFSNLECRFNREGGDVRWASYDYKYLGEPTWDWSTWDWRIKPPEPKTKEVTVWAHWIDALPELYGDKDVFFEKDNLSKSTSYRSTKLLAVKPITFTITEGEGL